MAAKYKWEAFVGSPPEVQGSWDFKESTADFTNDNLAAAGSIVHPVLALPQTTNLQQMGEYDAYPGTALTVASGSRVIGSGGSPIAILTKAWIFARTSAGGLYQPAAGSTLTLDVVNANEAAGANQNKTNIVAAVTLATFDTAIWNPLTFQGAFPADRIAARPDGTVVPSWMYLYTGDMVIATLTTTGALNVQGNTLAVVLEWV